MVSLIPGVSGEMVGANRTPVMVNIMVWYSKHNVSQRRKVDGYHDKSEFSLTSFILASSGPCTID